MIDNATLLIAIAFSSAALMIALLISWLNAREDNYLMSWAAGMAFVVVALAVLGLRDGRYDTAIQIGAFSPLLSGMALIHLGSFQFATASQRRTPTLLLWLAAMFSTNLTFVLGWSGPATALLNIWCAVFIALSGRYFWQARRESPLQMIVSVVLFGLTSLSFLACAIALVVEGNLVLSAPRTTGQSVSIPSWQL
ncbi:hypothetical protein PSC71_00570 [Devosia sp. J2-20]|uniref:hypothetical protein n=1 Tax=Devosia sp. J2-20 TaxID=3026161 RepID=UPI00249A821F|nr:hypothetical protein [Devosia sp. J2-20]WDQ99342.1 hypothetical protein PSC71_00570 [Devosia sp. J2-20]